MVRAALAGEFGKVLRVRLRMWVHPLPHDEDPRSSGVSGHDKYALMREGITFPGANYSAGSGGLHIWRQARVVGPRKRLSPRWNGG